MSRPRQPAVLYNHLIVGQWYQARFEFHAGESWTPLIDADPSTTTLASSSSSLTPIVTPAPPLKRIKSHRVLLVAKIDRYGPRRIRKAMCHFLTSIGGTLRPANVCDGEEQFGFIPVNSTPSISPYINIPISATSLYGLLKFSETYDLPADADDTYTDRIVQMPEARRHGGVVPVTSPEWAMRYIRDLRFAWLQGLYDGDLESRWPEVAVEVTSRFTSHVELPGLDGTDYCGDDSGIWVGDESVVEVAPVEQRLSTLDYRTARLLNVHFYDLDPNDDGAEDEAVDFELLDALFRPRPA